MIEMTAEYLFEQGVKLQTEIETLKRESERLREALEQICHPNMSPSGPAYGAMQIARAALGESK